MKQHGLRGADIFAIIITILMLSPIILAFIIQGGNSYNQVADGFTIEKYNVILDVNENNVVDVTEEITTNWNEAGHHGIYKFTPEWLEYTSKDGKTIKRKSVLTNYMALGEHYTIDIVKKKPRIKIGSAYKTLDLGDKEYIIKYTYDMGKDPYKGFDEFIFHAYGDYWGTEIKNASIELHLPKGIEDEKINFFIDKYRKNNVNDRIDYRIDNNVIYATYNSDIPLKSSLTIDVELKDNYFVGGSNNYGYKSMSISILIIILTLIIFYTWYKYGKDYQKRSETVEFYPPENLNPAEIGYIYGNKNYKKLTVALLVSLAAKGYIKINEVDKKEIEISNFMKIPKIKKYEDIFGNIRKREITVKKLKKYDSNLNSEETTMMKYLFKNGNEKKINANIDKFLKVKDSLISNGYIEIINDNNLERLDEIKNNKQIRKLMEEENIDINNLTDEDILNFIKNRYNKIETTYNLDVKIYNEEFSKLEKLSDIEEEIYNKLFEDDDTIILSQHRTFYTVFDKVRENIEKNLKDKIKDKVAASKIKWAVIVSIISLILSVISYRYVEDLNPEYSILYYISFLCIFINIFFAIIMKRKTEYGEMIIARVKGFKNFLETVEKENLEALVEKDSKYFYNILPFTYVLGVSKKWIKKFENIPMPEVDMGTIDYSSGSDIFSISNHVYYPAPTYSSSSSSGCSSCGGGCSSCGGGCSSCGGGGSW